jgi:hypothetical protein
MCERNDEELLKVLEVIRNYFDNEKMVSELLDMFWKSYQFDQKLSEAYEKFYDEIVKIQNNAPEKLKEVAKDTWNDMNFSKDVYRNELIEEFKASLYLSVVKMTGSVNPVFFCNTVQSVFFCKDYALSLNILEEISKSLSSFVLKQYVIAVYSCYTPEGMTVQQASKIRMLSGGGVMMPITSVFPEWFK